MAGNYGYAVGTNWKGILAGVGIQHEDVLRKAGLPDDLLNREDPRVSAEGFYRFSRALQESVPDPRFPLDLVRVMGASLFSPPIFAALCSPDLTVASRRLAFFKPLIAPATLDVTLSPAGLRLEYRWIQSSIEVPAFLHGFEVLFMVHLARMGTRHRVCPLAVTAPVLPIGRSLSEDFLGAKIRQGDVLSVTFSPEDALRPFLTANGEMWSIFEPALRKRLKDLEGSATYTERTRAVLLEALPSGQASIHAVSKRLSLSSRTLQRRLREEGTSFKEVVRETRERLARHYLTQTSLTSSEIAYLLGFEEPTSFFRAFSAWTGTTPEALRQST